jgi:hypothetical protein
MESACLKASDELAHVVWASVILSLQNPHTITTTGDGPSHRNQESLAEDREYEEDSDTDSVDDSTEDLASMEAGQLAGTGDKLRQKFLDCISELLEHTKGGKYVTATTLREKEEQIEVEIARNSDFTTDDKKYLASLERFLAMQGDGRFSKTPTGIRRRISRGFLDTSKRAVAEFSHDFLTGAIEYSAARVDAQARAVAREVKAASYRPLQQDVPDPFNTQGTCLLGCCSANQKPVSSQVQSLLFRFLNPKPWRSGLSTAEDQEKFRRETVELAATVTRSSEAIQATHATLRRILPSIDPSKPVKVWRVLARPVTNLRIL